MHIPFMILLFAAALSVALLRNETGYCLLHGAHMPILYNTSTHLCDNRTLVEKLTAPPPRTTTPVTPTRYTGPCDDPDDVFQCGTTVECGWLSGKRCCGPKAYLPAHQTCCIRMRYELRIFNKPEQDYVCCGPPFVLHPRIPEKIPCQHSAWNDPMWRPVTLETVDNEYRYCQDFSYAYLLRIGRKVRRAYKTTFRLITFRDNYKNFTKSEKFFKKMPKDRNSPKGRLTGSRRLILSNRDKTNDLDFYIHPNDLVIKVKGRSNNKRNMMRTFKKTLKMLPKC